MFTLNFQCLHWKIFNRSCLIFQVHSDYSDFVYRSSFLCGIPPLNSLMVLRCLSSPLREVVWQNIKVESPFPSETTLQCKLIQIFQKHISYEDGTIRFRINISSVISRTRVEAMVMQLSSSCWITARKCSGY